MKLNYKRTTLIGLAFMSILAFWQFYDQVIPYILENVFGQSTLRTNAIMAIDNVLAIFMLPLFGAISDRTHSRLGRRTPYVLYGTVAASVLMVLLALFEHAVNFPGFFVCLLLLLITMSIYRSPAVAYMPDVTPKPLRSKGNAVINLVGYVGGIFATVMMMVLLHKEGLAEDGTAVHTVYSSDQSFVPIFLVIAGFMLVTVLIMVLCLKENQILDEVRDEMAKEDDADENLGKGEKLPKDVRRSLILVLASVFLWFAAYNAVTTAFSRYCAVIWHVDLGASSGYLLVATVAAIAAFIPLGILSSRVGRKKAVLFGIVLMAACYALAIAIRKPSAVMYVIFALVGIGWASINVNSFPMVVEMCKAGDVGKYTGYYYTFSMAAQIVTPLLSGWLITKYNYNILFPYAVFFSLLSFVTMFFVRHGDNRPEAKTGLEAFEDLDA